jgi:hypothetical protein
MSRACVTILLLLLVYAHPTNAGQNAISQTASPTLAETTSWIQSHLTGLSHTSRKTVVIYQSKKGKPAKEVERQVTNTQQTVTVVSFEGCSMTLGQLTKGDDYSLVDVSLIPLGSLTRASWKTEQHDPVNKQDGDDSSQSVTVPASNAVFTLESTSKVIVWKRRSTGSVPLEVDTAPFEGNNTSLSINTDDEAMPPRLVKAFNHAIELCHVDAKPEPF